MIADWAEETTPEWIRAIGAMRDAFKGTSFEASLDKQYVKLLGQLAKRPDPYDDFAAVVRQLRERAYAHAAFTAARTGSDLHLDSSYLASVAANCASAIGNAPEALRYILRAAELMDAEDQPDARKAWESVVVRAEAVSDAATVARAKQRIAALE